MNISSYNITDVSYHYIGLRVLAGVPAHMGQRHQTDAISRSVRKFVNDRALRLMLPEPRGTFETVGKKIFRELVHFQFAHSVQTGYELTETGKKALNLLASRKHVELRRLMVTVHLKTYDNLRSIVQTHLEVGSIWRPIIESACLEQRGYFQKVLKPTFGCDAPMMVVELLDNYVGESPKGIEDAIHRKILRRVMPNQKISVALFRSICDRLVSLRLLNVQRTEYEDCTFLKSYSPCVSGSPSHAWYMPLELQLANGGMYKIYLCEPNMADTSHQMILLEALDETFSTLSPEGGYYDIPEVRNLVCERLWIPEAAFDDGVNYLLDMSPPVLSVGFRYERISGRRKPLVRNRQTTQIHNLVRRV